jgi:hypothetical protein
MVMLRVGWGKRIKVSIGARSSQSHLAFVVSRSARTGPNGNRRGMDLAIPVGWTGHFFKYSRRGNYSKQTPSRNTQRVHRLDHNEGVTAE